MPDTSRKNLPLGCLIVFLLPFFAVGIGTFGYAVYLTARGCTASSWPVAEGVITQSGTRGSTDSKGNSNLHTDIHYTYEWQGRKLEGDAVRMGSDVLVNGKSPGLAEDLAHYPLGKRVQVRVDPARPEKAVLEAGVAWVPVAFFSLFGVVFGGMASLFLFLGIRQSRKKEAGEAKAGDVIQFDAEQGDTAPAQVEWAPLKMGGANFQTCQLQETKDGLWRVVPTKGMWLFALLFGGMGAGTMIVGAVVKADIGWGRLIPLFGGAVFVLCSAAMIHGMRRGVVFAPGDRMCLGLVEDPSKFRKIRSDIPFFQVSGLQMLAQQHAGGKDSAPYTSYQLNLVLKDFTRRGVMAHGKKEALERDADALAQILRVPLWKRV